MNLIERYDTEYWSLAIIFSFNISYLIYVSCYDTFLYRFFKINYTLKIFSNEIKGTVTQAEYDFDTTL